MMLSLAPGARLVTRGCAVLALTATVGASMAVAKDARRPPRQTIIEDIAPPTRESFDEIVVQLPPLVPVRRNVQAPAPAAAAAQQPAPAASSTPPLPLAAQSDRPAPDSHDQDIQTTRAAANEPTARDVAAPDADAQPAAAPLSAEAQPAPSLQNTPAAPEIETPKESVVEHHTVESAEPSHAQPIEASPSDIAAPLDLRRGDQPAESSLSDATPAAEPQPPVVDGAQPEVAAAAETAKPAPTQDSVASEGEGDGSIFETWQLIVAALALGGLLVVRRRGKTTPAAPKEAAVRSAKIAKIVAFAKSARTKLAPIVAAKLERVRSWRAGLMISLRKRSASSEARKTLRTAGAPAAEASAKAERPIVDWPAIAATLRAKVAPPKGSSVVARRSGGAGAAAAQTESTTESLAERGRWEQADQDGPELLEPGASSTHAIIMNARKKFRAAQG